MFRDFQKVRRCMQWVFLITLLGSHLGCTGIHAKDDMSAVSSSTLAESEQLFHTGKFSEAEHRLSEALEANPTQHMLLNARGFVYAKQKHWQHAIKDFTQAIRLAPQHHQYRENLGIVYLEAGYPDMALQQFSHILQHSPDSVNTLNKRGLAFNRLGQYQSAIRDFSRALALDHSQADIYLNRAVAYLQIGDTAEGRKNLEQAISRNQTLPQAYESLGLLELLNGETTLAIKDFTKAIRLGADGGLVHYNRGIALTMVGDHEEAKEEYELACERNIFQACNTSVTLTHAYHRL
ncbi:tetratricopeptide repeat protein [Nitrospira sp. M1]